MLTRGEMPKLMHNCRLKEGGASCVGGKSAFLGVCCPVVHTKLQERGVGGDV